MRLVHYRYKPEFAATAGIEAAAPETGKDLGAGIWHLVTPPLSPVLWKPCFQELLPSTRGTPPLGILALWETCPFARSPCTLTLEVWQLWPRDPRCSAPWMNIAFILLDLCLLSLVVCPSGSLPPSPAYPAEPHTLIPGTATLSLGNCSRAPWVSDFWLPEFHPHQSQPLPPLWCCGQSSLQHTLGLSLPRCHRSGGEGDPA